MIHRPKSQMYGFYCINVLKMAQFEKLSHKKIFEFKILKGWHPPDLENFTKKMENRTFGHCIEFISFGWPYNSYCDSWQRYVASNDGQGADKSILVPRFGPFRLNLGPKMTKIEIFGHFNEFGTSDRVEIAYFDSTKQSSRFGHGISHVLHN